MKFKFDIYQRHFKQPLRTNHGIWRIREGIIISLSDGVNTALGEIAPLPWFGSETMSDALKFCQQWDNAIAIENIIQIRDTLPACQFAFESAWLDLQKSDRTNSLDKLDYCYLLPPGEAALEEWQKIYQSKNNTTFKWKIGVYPLQQEIKILQQLVVAFPPGIKLRLDANGGLNLDRAKQLLTITDKLKAIEFIEQPLPPKHFAEMQHLSQEYTTPIALDESVANFQQLKIAKEQGWREIFVVKAAIAGFPTRLIQYCQNHSLDVVFSSVFETQVGRNAILKLASTINHPRAVGFGVNHWIK